MSGRRAADLRLRLLLVRHADAGDPGAWLGPDAERPLSDKGVKQAARLAAALLAAKCSVDEILTSPARRCGETAAILAEALRSEEHTSELQSH